MAGNKVVHLFFYLQCNKTFKSRALYESVNLSIKTPNYLEENTCKGRVKFSEFKVRLCLCGSSKAIGI